MKKNLFCIFCLTLLFCSNLLAQNSNKKNVKDKGLRRIRQTTESATRKSKGCLTCHKGIENMHRSSVVKLGCVDCHGGNPRARTVAEAHVKPRYPEKWKTSANPVRSFTLLNKEDPDFIKFVNPGDLRIADETCGSCHPQEVLNSKKSMMATSALFWGEAAYSNGIVSTKRSIFGESYSREGVPQIIMNVPPPTPDEIENKGVLPFLAPLPRWEITQPGNLFRAFERGGKVSRINPSNIGSPDPEQEPGKPDIKLSDRGLGTQLSISSPVLGLHKTRLNDPHLYFLGTNEQPGDYRSSGCTACHVVYANDRSEVHSGPYAQYGNLGKSQTDDKTISKKEEGHPLKHEFTNSIPSSQCMVCHMHQPNGFLNTYYGFQWWDYETDGEMMYPKKQKYLSDEEKFALLEANPEEAVLRGKWGNKKFLTNVSKLNPRLKKTQFADYHGHGWIFRAVFHKDRKGNLLDESNNNIPWESEHKFHGVVPILGQDLACDESCQKAQKAVHLKDIHLEKGMHCVDCHFDQDVHGSGKLHDEFQNAVEIKCVDCHGDVTYYSKLRTSGVAAPEGGTDLALLNTPFGEPRFEMDGDIRIQRSMLIDTLVWEISQVKASIEPNSSEYNPKSRAAKLVAKGGGEFEPGAVMNTNLLAHSNKKIECQACHTAWTTNCFGCHLPQQANWKKSMNHFEGSTTRNTITYNPQVLRDGGFMLCISGGTSGNKVTTARPSADVILSSRNANREQTYSQQTPISAPGFSSQAFNPHFSHTMRKKEAKTCSDCHISEKNDNNAWMAQMLLQGTNLVNFMGKYVYVAEGREGFEAVAVTETDEPQAVIGSNLQKLAYPDYYQKHRNHGRELQTAFHHGGSYVRSLQLRGEYLFTANGADGFRVFDVANIDNKGISERIVSAPVSPFGQDTHVKSRFATAVALPTNNGIDTRRKSVIEDPANAEQPIHPLYSYAYITDKYEGLIIVDVMNLVDGDPQNNFLKREVTFNPGGILRDAVNLAIVGNYVYVLCKAGLVVVSIDNPRKPKIVGSVRSPKLNRPLAISIQFRYAYVCDKEGVKTLDITDLEKPRLVENSIVRLKGASDIYAARTYAYVAARTNGLVIIDIEKPDSIFVQHKVTANGRINDARGVKVASTNNCVFAYVADGKNGLRVLQLTSPHTPGHLGFSPDVKPLLIATRKTSGVALAISKGLDRDRGADESGNQISVFGRVGSRPFNREEQKAFYLNDKGQVYKVSDDYWKQFIK